MERFAWASLTAISVIALIGCGGGAPESDSPETSIRGAIAIDGSSTVYPVSEAVAEEFRNEQPRIRVTIGVSGTGGGFKKFAVGDTDISDASRPIKAKEQKKAAENGVEYIELPVAFDGLSVVINPGNGFVDHLTTEELRRIWQPESTVTTWSDVRPEWPDRRIKLYGPGTDSGTFDYFTEAINGKSQACRADFTASEDDNVLVAGVAGDVDALGFFGFAYYVENKSRLKVVPIDGGKGPVAPSTQTINDGSYAPLSRPLFIYVSTQSLDQPAVRAFVDYYLDNVATLAGEVGYVGLPTRAYDLARQRVSQRLTGSVFSGRDTVGLDISELLALE
jgi:phosphate transport system substrate-binding protein